MRREIDHHPGTIVLAPGMVSLDWLTLNMSAPEKLRISTLPWEYVDPVRWDYKLDPHPTNWCAYLICSANLRTAQFSRVSYLTDLKGEKLATISSAPHDGSLHGADWMQIQFANATLYSGEWVQIFRMFRDIGCSYRGISRIDVACDGIAGDGGDFPAVVAMAQQGKARYYGKCEWLQRSDRSQVIGAEFGSRASNKFIRAYRKKREMKSKGQKPWITEGWKRAFGFDAWATEGVEINRFEVALKGKEIRRHFDGEGSADWLEGMANVGQRVDVFASMAPRMFDFRTVAERARDAVPVCEWDWSRVDASANVADRAEQNLAISEHTVKTGLRSMFMVAHYTCDKFGFEACERYAEAAGEHYWRWYMRKRAEWVKKFEKIERAKDSRTMELLARLRDAGNGADS
jgi:hypothetical protein